MTKDDLIKRVSASIKEALIASTADVLTGRVRNTDVAAKAAVEFVVDEVVRLQVEVDALRAKLSRLSTLADACGEPFFSVIVGGHDYPEHPIGYVAVEGAEGETYEVRGGRAQAENEMRARALAELLSAAGTGAVDRLTECGDTECAPGTGAHAGPHVYRER